MCAINFIDEINELNCQRYNRSYPMECIERAADVADCIEKKTTPANIEYAFMKITHMCNSDCEYCEHAFSINKNKEQIPFSELEKVVVQLGNAGVRACSVSGGEPLVYQDIDKLIRAFVKAKIEPVLLTNGILLPEKADKLYDSGLRYVIMSIDSFNPEHYSRVRGVSFSAVSSSYSYMRDFIKKNKDLKFRITSVLSKENIDDVHYLAEKVLNDGIGLQLTPYHNFINGEKGFEVNDIKKVVELCKFLFELKSKGYPVLNSEEYLKYFPDFFDKGKRIPDNYECKCGYNCVYIWPNMDVRFCWSTSLAVAGNLKKNTLNDIWKSENYKLGRERMLQCKCEGCWLLCTAEFNILHEKYEEMKN